MTLGLNLLGLTESRHSFVPAARRVQSLGVGCAFAHSLKRIAAADGVRDGLFRPLNRCFHVA